MNKQIEEMTCKNCIHYQMCVNTFRKGKQDGEYLLIEEEAYFANANGCDFYADKRIYRKQSEGEWKATTSYCFDYICTNCGEGAIEYEDQNYTTCYHLTKYCPNCGAKMKGGE